MRLLGALLLTMVLAGCQTTGNVPSVTDSNSTFVEDIIPFTTMLDEQKSLLTQVPCHHVHGPADSMAVQKYGFGCQAGTFVTVQILMDESPHAAGYVERVRLLWREWDEGKHPAAVENKLITPYLNYVVDNFVPAELHQNVRYNFARRARKSWLAPDVRIDYRVTEQPYMMLHRLEIAGRGGEIPVEPAPEVVNWRGERAAPTHQAPRVKWQGERVAPVQKPRPTPKVQPKSAPKLVVKPKPKPVVKTPVAPKPKPQPKQKIESEIRLLPPVEEPEVKVTPAPKPMPQPKPQLVTPQHPYADEVYVPVAPQKAQKLPKPLETKHLSPEEARHLRRLQMLGVDLKQIPSDDKYFGDEL